MNTNEPVRCYEQCHVKSASDMKWKIESNKDIKKDRTQLFYIKATKQHAHACVYCSASVGIFRQKMGQDQKKGQDQKLLLEEVLQ